MLQGGGLCFPRAMQQPFGDEAQCVCSQERPARQENTLSPDQVSPGLHRLDGLSESPWQSCHQLEREHSLNDPHAVSVQGDGENCQGY